MDLRHLLAPFDPGFDIDEALEAWRWLIPEPVRPLALTAFGDLFVVSGDDGVLFLETTVGRLSRVAESVAGWREQLGNPEQIEEWFMPTLLSQLHAAGNELSEGQCFTTKRAICLGGEFMPENWEPGFWKVHLYFYGALCEQLKDLPDGTKITKINFTPI